MRVLLDANIFLDINTQQYYLCVGSEELLITLVKDNPSTGIVACAPHAVMNYKNNIAKPVLSVGSYMIVTHADRVTCILDVLKSQPTQWITAYNISNMLGDAVGNKSSRELNSRLLRIMAERQEVEMRNTRSRFYEFRHKQEGE